MLGIHQMIRFLLVIVFASYVYNSVFLSFTGLTIPREECFAWNYYKSSIELGAEIAAWQF